MSQSESKGAQAESQSQSQQQEQRIEIATFMEEMKTALIPSIQEMIKSQLGSMLTTTNATPNSQIISTGPDYSGEIFGGEKENKRPQDDEISLIAESTTVSYKEPPTSSGGDTLTANSQNAIPTSSTGAPRLRRKVADDVASLLKPLPRKGRSGRTI